MDAPTLPSPRPAARPARGRARRVLAAAALVMALVGAACSDAGQQEAAGVGAHAGHGAGSVPPLRPVAPDSPEVLAPTAPVDALYAVDGLVPAGRHGTLLRYQEIVPSPFPSARAYRILYLSESLAAEPVAVSGTAFVPIAAAPAGGRTVVGVAHATTGLADECAPSRAMGAELPLLGVFADAGHLVVATDYEGLGTAGPHPYLVGTSAGRSVLDAVRAAQQLPSAEAGDRVGLAGYSQGGHGALWADRLAAGWTPELEVVGTVAGAPATELDQIVERPGEVPFAGFVPMLVAGLATTSPYVRPATYLTPLGLEIMATATSGCLADVEEASAGVDGRDLVRADAPVEAWSQAAAVHDPGLAGGDDPVLLVHSEADDTIPVGTSEEVAARLCGGGQDVERIVLTSGADHVVGAVEAYPLALAWLGLRFAGEPLDPASTVC